MSWAIPTNVTSITALMKGVNDMIGNDIPAYMFIWTIFFVTFVAALSRTETEKALLLASWMTTITSLAVVVIFEISAYAMVLPLIMTLVSAFLVKRHD